MVWTGRVLLFWPELRKNQKLHIYPTIFGMAMDMLAWGYKPPLPPLWSIAGSQNNAGGPIVNPGKKILRRNKMDWRRKVLALTERNCRRKKMPASREAEKNTKHATSRMISEESARESCKRSERTKTVVGADKDRKSKEKWDSQRHHGGPNLRVMEQKIGLPGRGRKSGLEWGSRGTSTLLAN